MKANKNTRGRAVSNHGGRKDKESESSTDSAAHTQILKQTNKKTIKWQESSQTYHY
jgi:hypothetical protein